MATWHLTWPEMRPSTFGGGVTGANLLPPFIPGTEHILTRKLKSPGSHHWLLIASVNQWEGKMAPGHQHRDGGRGDLAAEWRYGSAMDCHGGLHPGQGLWVQ